MAPRRPRVGGVRAGCMPGSGGSGPCTTGGRIVLADVAMYAQSVSLAGVTVWLRSDRTAWLPPDQAGGVADGAAGHAPAGTEWPAGGTLLVADVHLGKAHQFSALRSEEHTSEL